MFELLSDIPSEPAGWTVILELIGSNPGAVAVIMALPAAAPVTLNPIICAPAGIKTEVGVVTTFGLSEASLNVMGPGAGPESVIVRAPSPGMPKTVKLAGDSVAVAPTVTSDVAEFSPVAVTVIVVRPVALAVMFDCRAGSVCPTPIVELVGKTVAAAGLLLVMMMVTGDCAGVARLTGNGWRAPGASVSVAGRMTRWMLCTV